MKTSMIILTHNQFHHTVLCLESIRKWTSEPYEIIVVDNGSTDGLTVMYLKLQPDVILICNDHNAGFAAGCNQGLEVATGEHILFLNNDTVVTPNWLTHLLAALHASPDIGMVGPLTNYSSGHQIIPVPYTDLLDLNAFAHEHGTRNQGKTTEVRRLIGFCLLAKRAVLEEVGGFDEIYDIGNFEDDDLCLRVARAGYRLVIANASFIHHVGHATMKELQQDTPQNNVQYLMGINRNKAKEKWGEDIFDLIYKEDAKLTCCVLADTESALIKALDSIKDIADEIIVVDISGACEAISQSYAASYVKEKPRKSRMKQWERAVQQAAGPYILLLEAGEYVSEQARRKIRALKRSISPDGAVATMKFEQREEVPATKQVRLFHRSFPLSYLDKPKSYKQEVLDTDIVIHYEFDSRKENAIH
ncbi:glycosyltransferase family 2 protein [Paenibacillus sp. 481]|uniref:glycosyltransferase family 2 protein n=1 Tax=Paenibacillus sp. 481 TaxID=2835869 RepID=UPI001E3054A3|nr:glycosyltransferase family 2 protein [Paenibacillus sp. 481]UHA72725.1 glycosyltransferase family 2 protein [Paenibacillus sp. 481]